MLSLPLSCERVRQSFTHLIFSFLLLAGANAPRSLNKSTHARNQSLTFSRKQIGGIVCRISALRSTADTTVGYGD